MYANSDQLEQLIVRFLNQSNTNDLGTSSYPKSIGECQLKVSFGVGNQARIPWIGALRPPNKPRNGIYPVLLYFKEDGYLLASYGVSEEQSSFAKWEDLSLPTVSEWYSENLDKSPYRYGKSYVKSAYKVEDLDVRELASDFLQIIEDYSSKTFDIIEDHLPLKQNKVWLVGPGELASEWERFYNSGIIGLGWKHVGSLEGKSKQDINHEIKLHYNKTGSAKNDTLALWEFYSKIKVGDLIIVKKGQNYYLGYGYVSSDYYYSNNDDDYPHQRKVNWKKKGQWPEENGSIVQKTLTNIGKNQDYVEQLKKLMGITDSEILGVKYWWLNANPKYWRITDFEIGQEQSYTTHNEKGNKRRIYEYFKAVKPGDLVIGYESTPTKKVTAILRITQGIHEDSDSGDEVISFEIERFIDKPISLLDIRSMSEMKDAEVLKNNQGSLFKLTQQEFQVLAKQQINEEEYSIDHLLTESFIEEEDAEDILSILGHKQNIILQGPPGTGKTFIAKRLAYAYGKMLTSSYVEMIQFHQSYSYEDFIQGYRPKEDGSFKLQNGIFYRFCKRAMANPSKPYFFIIDEINRGNLSKIFGELMLLIEKDKRGQEFKIALQYSDSEEVKFFIPNNVFVIGTMNTADRSLAVVDYALRRRFAFIDMEPLFNEKFKRSLVDLGITKNLADLIIKKFSELNYRLSNERNLGKGFQIGHSYFCQYNSDEDEKSWYRRIIEFEIAPLLREYWYDDIDRAKDLIQELHI